jgi:cytochrome bd-type quinol oxidase subunit 2
MDDPSSPPIQSGTLFVTQVSGIATGITTLGTAAIALFTINAQDEPAVKVAKIAAAAIIIAMGLISTAMIVAADMRARATATAATPSPGSSASPPVAAAQSPVLTVTLAAGGDEVYAVIAADHRSDGTHFLVAHGNGVPVWKKQSEISSFKAASPAS